MNTLKILAPLLVVILYGNALVAQDAEDKSTPRTKLTMKVVAGLVAHVYMGESGIDDKFCSKWIGKYIEMLDPMHLYFLESDVLEFRTLSAQLPKIMKDGDPQFFKLVTSRYQSRVESALTHVEQRIDRGFDFSIDEEKPLFFDNWPQSIDDRNERWRMQLKHDLLVEQSSKSNYTEAVEFVKTRYASIRLQAKNLPKERAVEIFLDSFCLAADPHCDYFTARLYNSFIGSISLDQPYFTGLQFRYRKGRAMIYAALPDFEIEPAQPSLIGSELLAIRTRAGVVHNIREIDPNAINQLICYGLGKESSVTLELYDEVRQRRFSVDRSRKRPSL